MLAFTLLKTTDEPLPPEYTPELTLEAKLRRRMLRLR